MDDKIDHLLQQIKQAIDTHQLTLPSLPDVAERVRNACTEDAPSSTVLAEIIAEDPAIAVRIMQIANSSFYLSCSRAEDLPMAITRIGLNMVRDLVMSLALKQLYQAPNDILQERLQELWLAGVKTAALARILCRSQTRLNPEQAMIAGLTHNVGALPVLLLAANDHELMNDASTLATIIQLTQPAVGAYMFAHWKMAEFMIDVALHCYDFERRHKGTADYVDVVQVALVESSIYTGLECPEDWSAIPAFGQLGMDGDIDVLEIGDNKLIFDETQSLLL